MKNKLLRQINDPNKHPVSFRLLALLLCFFSVSLTLPALAQESKITLKLKNKPLSEVLDQIEVKSGYSFLVRNNDVNLKETVSIDVVNQNVDVVLDKLFKQSKIHYEIKGKNISIFIPQKSEDNSGGEAKNRKITGSVKDQNGNPVIGASVMLKNIAKGSVTDKGTITDNDGKFSLEAYDNAILQVSFMGYETENVSVSGRNALIITLVEKTKELSSVVVIGYGASTKRDLTAAISTAPMEKISSIASPSINNELGGRIPGLLVTGQGGGPGVIDEISIRGGGTPLFIIDGIPRTEADYQNINPNDVESFSVLKDGQAAAVYGANAGNGVIVITTKKGKEGKLSVTYGYSDIITKPSITPERMSSYDIAYLENQASTSIGGSPKYTDEQLELYKNGTDPYNYPNVKDPQYQYLKKYATEQRHDFSLTAGTKTLNCYAALSHYHQGSLVKAPEEKDFNDLTTWRLNVGSYLENIRLKVDVNLDGYYESTENPNSGTWDGTGYTPNRQRFYYYYFNEAANTTSMTQAFNEYGLPVESVLAATYEGSGYGKETKNVVNGVLKFDWECPFVKGLHFIETGSYKFNMTTDKMWTASAPLYQMGSNVPIASTLAANLLGQQTNGMYYNLQSMVTYKNEFGKHSVGFTGVAERSYGKKEYIQAQRTVYTLDLDQFLAGPTTNMIGYGAESITNAAIGFVGRLTYNYNKKYFIEATTRYDGDYRFPSSKRWGVFPGVSAGWILSEEKFMSGLVENGIIDLLKVRASWAEVGLVSGGLDKYKSLYNIKNNAYKVGGALQNSLEEGDLPSQAFSWYSTTNRDLGFDLTTLGHRLNIGFDYYYQRTAGYTGSDSAYVVTLGKALPAINTDKALRKEGVDFSISYNDRIREFKYKVGFNFTYYNQLWENYNESTVALSNPYTRIAGYSDNYFDLGFINLGYYQKNSDLLYGARYISASTNVGAGDLKYEDANGDGKIDANDKRKIGRNTFPHINYGLTINLEYKGITLDALLMGTGHRDIILGSPINSNIMIFEYQKDAWTPTNTDALFPRMMLQPSDNANNNTQTSDFWLADAMFLRMKSLQLSYDLKRMPVMKKMPFTRFLVSLTARNLFTISPIMKYGIDPEQYSYNTSGLSGTMIANNYGYPLERSYALGCSVSF